VPQNCLNIFDITPVVGSGLQKSSGQKSLGIEICGVSYGNRGYVETVMAAPGLD
jgi:hypothetical protein